VGPAAPGASGDPSGQHVSWAQLPGAPVGVGQGTGMAADAAGAEAVVFGGNVSGALSNTTQVYDEAIASWSTVATTHAPSPRSDFGFATNDSARLAVLFGGVVDLASRAVDNSTWLFDFGSNTWTNVSGPVAPPARADPALAVDPSSDLALLYGGWDQDYRSSGTLTFGDLWAFNFSTDAWTQWQPSGPSPPPLEGASFGWDSQSGTFLLYGGCYPCSSTVWQLDPVSRTWSVVSPADAAPTPRAQSAVAWNPIDSALTVFGGTNGAVAFNDTWEFAPATGNWTAEAAGTAPAARWSAASAWLNVPGNQTLLMTGGTGAGTLPNALWRLAPTANLTLLVENASSGLPVASAKVVLGSGPAASTNASGYLNLTAVTANETTVNVSHIGFADSQRSFWIAPDSTAFEQFLLSPVPDGNVSVRIVNESGAPVAGAAVSLRIAGAYLPDSNGTSDLQGYVSYPNVPSGVPAPTGVVTASGPGSYSNSTAFVLPPGARVSVVVVLVSYPRLVIQVTGALANLQLADVAHANISENDLLLGSTDAAGWLNATSILPGGTVQLAIVAEGFSVLGSKIVLPHSGTLNESYRLSGLEFGRIAVAVDDGSTGDPIGGATVAATADPSVSSVAYTDSHPTTDAGSVTLSVPQGAYWVNVSSYGYYPDDIGPVWVPSAGTVSLGANLSLEPGANVSVFVRVYHHGPPVVGARVLAGAALPVNTSDTGWANFTDLRFGPTLVNVTAVGFLPNETLVVLAPFETISEYLVNLTPAPLVPGHTSNGTYAYGGVLPTLAALPAYLVLLALAVGGALVFLLYLRIDRGAAPDDLPPPPFEGAGPGPAAAPEAPGEAPGPP